jgi:type I restriction enzyme S subunit
MSGWIVARAVAVLRLRDPEDALYLRLVLMSAPLRRLMDVSSNSTIQKTLNLREFKKFPIPWPSRRERMRIVRTFEALDAKTECNRAITATLEEMARAVYKDWFVDLGPSRTRAAGSRPYLSPTAWAQFPDRLDGIGKPIGWTTVEVGTVAAELRRGITPMYMTKGGVRVLNQKCVRRGRVFYEPARRHDPGARALAGRALQIGDVLVNSTGVGTVGRVGQVWAIDEPTIVDGHITLIRADTRVIDPYFLGANLSAREHEIARLGEGSTGQTELSKTRLASLPVLLPSLEIQTRFAGIVKPLIERMLANERENQSLHATRQFLLAKLIPDVTRARDAARLVEETA